MSAPRTRNVASSEDGSRRSSAAKLRVGVIGGVHIEFADRPVVLSNRRARAILAYLALSDTGSEQRERLAGLLWSDTSERNARASLRQVLADLRDGLEPIGCRALEASREAVALSPDAIELDVDLIVERLSAGSMPDVLLSRPRLSESLLAGFEDLSEAFQDWIFITRRRVHERLLLALKGAFDSDQAPVSHRRRAAEMALLLDPMYEEACRQVMRFAADAGETGAALRAYSQLYRVLSEEMDMEPSIPTQELVAKIKQGEYAAAETGRPARDIVQNGRPGLSSSSMIATGEPTVAVLPFRFIGPESAPIAFAEGVVEDTVRMLATLREPVVISSNSTRRFHGDDLDLRSVGKLLGVRYIVTGTVRKLNGTLRLSVELVNADNSVVLWAKSYQVSEPYELRTQDELAINIAHTLVPRLRDAELKRMRNKPPEDLAIYHLILQAREIAFRLERSTFDEAGEVLNRAIEIDPYYAPAHTDLANWYSVRLGQGWSADPEADLHALESSAREAISLDLGNGRALALLGHTCTTRSRDYDEALNLFDRALDSSPNDAETLMWSSPTYSFIGEAGEGIRRAERAISLSPHDPFLFRYEHFLSIGHYSAGDFTAAVDYGRRSLQRNPHYTSNLRLTAAALVGLGHKDEARALTKKVMELQPGFRVAPFIAQQAFRDEDRRNQFGNQLLDAGLPG